MLKRGVGNRKTCPQLASLKYSTSSIVKPFGYDQLQKLLADPEISQSLKSNTQISIPSLVGRKEKAFPFIEREDIIQPVLAAMENRWKSNAHTDRRDNPLVGFHSTSGGGKSYLVDEFLGLNLKDDKVMGRFGKQLKTPNWFSTEFVESIRIPVTFNRQMTSSIFTDNPRLDLHSRLLYSRFIDVERWSVISFASFQAKMDDFQQLISPKSHALDLICFHDMTFTRHGPRRVIIFLDEILKAQDPVSALHEACIMMDLVSSGRWKTVDVLSTTLDPTILAKLQTRSGRKSSVFPLPALHDIKRLFPEPIAFNLAVRLAGHPSAMEELNVFLRTDPTYHELIKPRQTENRKARSSKEADKWQEKRDGQLNELMDQVRKLAKSLPRMSQDDAVVALLSKYVTFEEKFTNAADTAIDKVMNGTYLNSLNDLEDSFVPLVSIMQLLNYAKSKPDNALRNALLDFIEKDTLACFKGYPFEAFHAHWERVIHECYRVQRVRKLSLKDYYLDGIQILTRKLVSVQLEIPDVTKSISIYKRGFMEDFFNPGTKFVDSNAEAFFQGYHIYHCNSEKQSTAAFDFCHVFKDKTRQRTKILLHGETRYSVPNDTKELSTLLSFPDDILNKRKKLEKEYINAFDSAGCKSAEFDEKSKTVRLLDKRLKIKWGCDSVMPVLVVITPRKYGKVIGAHIEELEKSVIPVAVLDIDGLKKAYGPSICSTQLFQSAEELNRRFALRD